MWEFDFEMLQIVQNCMRVDARAALTRRCRPRSFFSSSSCIRTAAESFIRKNPGRVNGAKMFIWIILWIERLKGTAKVRGGPSVAWERPAERRDQSSHRSTGDIFNREVQLRAKCHATKRLPVLAFCEATLTSCFFSLVTQTINHQLQDFDFSNDQ